MVLDYSHHIFKIMSDTPRRSVCCRYEGLFPSDLFHCSDNIYSMHFILSLKYMADAQYQELMELLNHCGAEVSISEKDATQYSAVIVDHDEVVTARAPAFTIQYLEDCLRGLTVLDISKYRQNATRHIATNVNCMDVVFFNRMRWDSGLTTSEKQWLEGCQPKDVSQLGEKNSKNTNGCRLSDDEDSDLDESVQQVSERKTCERATGSEDNSNSSKVFNSTSKGNTASMEPNKRHKVVSLRRKENCKTINGHILSSDEDSDLDESVQQNEISTCDGAMESEDVSNSNKALSQSKSVTASQVSNKRVKARVQDIDSILGGENSKSNNEFTLSDDQDSDLEDSDQVGPEKRTCVRVKDVEESLTTSKYFNSKPKSGTLTTAESQKDFFSFDAAKEDLFSSHKDKKHSRMPYSYEEQSKILKYIIEHHEFSRCKGREMWMIMERRKVCPNRTWQSMKEHFLKKILSNLEAFDFLTKSDLAKIKQAMV